MLRFVSRLLAVALFGVSGEAIADGFQDTIKFRTGDGYFIEATLGVPLTDDERVAGVVLVHSEGRSRAEWDGLFDTLLGAGYLVLSYDIRGHGNSTALPADYPRNKLASDPDMAPRDLASAIKVVAGLDMVDEARVAVIGASLGGSLACAAVEAGLAKTAVALSAKTAEVQNLARTFDLAPGSGYYVASSGDDGGRYATWAKALYAKSGEPKRLEIVENSSRRGVSLVVETPGLADRIVAWLAEAL